MTASFPSSVWDGESKTRANNNTNRSPDGHDWQRLADEIRAFDALLDAIGVGTDGTFATSDPDKGKRLFANTLVLTLGGNTATEDFPNKWDKTTLDRDAVNADDFRAPTPGDWRTLIIRINNLEKRVQPLGLPLASSEPSEGDKLWSDGTNEVQSLGAIASTSGNWTLTITLPGNTAKTTASIAFDATAAAIQTAVDNALAGLSVNGVEYTAGDITVAGGPINSSAVTLTFDGVSVQNTNVAEVTTADVDLNDATPPTPSTTTPGAIGSVTVSDEAGTTTLNLWDGTSPSRPDPDVERQPDWQDYEEATNRLRTMMQLIEPLGFAADGGLPTSDPNVRGELFTDTNVVKVSSG